LTVIGDQVKNPKKTWETAVLKAHGHTPTWKGTTLDADSRARYRAVDLHFHDLRHEGASRLLDQGWPLHHVQAMLGHADAKTTSIHCNVTTQHLQDSMKRFAPPLQTVAKPAEIEHPPLCKTDAADAPEVVVN
jgi:integrase